MAAIRFAPDLVEAVKANTKGLNEAYAEAQKRKKALVSIAFQLQSRGLSYRQIADRLGVTHPTVKNWVVNFSTAPELTNEPTLPDAETLDRIAQAIKDDAKGEVRASARSGRTG